MTFSELKKWGVFQVATNWRIRRRLPLLTKYAATVVYLIPRPDWAKQNPLTDPP
jgi:hypothetical protein